jgi:hypothetical protein
LALGPRDGDHYQGLGLLQIIRDPEIKMCETFLIEFFIQQALPVPSFDFFLQIAKVLDRYDACFTAAL